MTTGEILRGLLLFYGESDKAADTRGDGLQIADGNGIRSVTIVYWRTDTMGGRLPVAQVTADFDRV